MLDALELLVGDADACVTHLNLQLNGILTLDEGEVDGDTATCTAEFGCIRYQVEEEQFEELPLGHQAVTEFVLKVDLECHLLAGEAALEDAHQVLYHHVDLLMIERA